MYETLNLICREQKKGFEKRKKSVKYHEVLVCVELGNMEIKEEEEGKKSRSDEDVTMC